MEYRKKKQKKQNIEIQVKNLIKKEGFEGSNKFDRRRNKRTE